MKRLINFFTNKKEVIDDSKEILFRIGFQENDFTVHSSIPIDKNTFNQKEKTMLLIALHQLKENILHDKFPIIKEKN